MKTFCLSIALFTMIAGIYAQGPITWKFSAVKLSDKSFEVHFTASVDQPWHIYSQNTPTGGPQPTQIAVKKSALVTMTGKAKEIGDVIRRHEDVFGINVLYYENKADFVQLVTLKADVKTTLTGTVAYMVCNDRMCLPPAKVSFSIPLK